jgi:glucan-binding YG repeat protein
LTGYQKIGSNYYCFDSKTGAAKFGDVTVDKIPGYFDPKTGVGLNGWRSISGKDYWYENGKRRGTKYDPKGVYFDGTNRGCEVVAPDKNGKLAWFWLDSIYNGAKAVSKEVMMPYTYNGRDTTPKWVRYDANGAMIKGWYTTNGKTYYYNLITGAMTKGTVTIDGKPYTFDSRTGVLQ